MVEPTAVLKAETWDFQTAETTAAPWVIQRVEQKGDHLAGWRDGPRAECSAFQ